MLERNYNPILKCWQQHIAAEMLQKMENNETILSCAMDSNLHPAQRNGARGARHHSKGEDEEGNCKEESMRRCADALCLLKANRQHGRKQDRRCLNRAELSIEDPSKLTL